MKKITALVFLTGCAVQPATDVQVQGASGDGTQDIRPPAIAVTSHAAGGWFSDESIDLVARVIDIDSGIASATINGRSVPLFGSGRGRTIAAPVALSPGVNTITLTATDIAGNTTEKRMSVMGGDFESPDSSVSGASVVELNGPMMDGIAEPMTEAFGNRDLISKGIKITEWTECAVFEGDIMNMNVGDAIVTVTPTADQVILDVSYTSMTAVYSGDADLCGIEEPFEITMSHPGPHYQAMLDLSVVDGAVVAEIASATMDLTGATLTSNVDEALEEHDLFIAEMGIDEMFAETAIAVIGNTPPEAFPGAFAHVLPSDSGVKSVGAMDIDYDMEGIFVDEAGIAVSYAASIAADEEAVITSADAVVMDVGSMTRSGEAPIVSTSSVNLINRAMHAGWESGRAAAFVNAEDKDLTLLAMPMLPPVMSPGDPLTVDLGEVYIKVLNEDVNVARITAQATAEISFETDEIGQPVMVATVTSTHTDSHTGLSPSVLSGEIQEAIEMILDSSIPRFSEAYTPVGSIDPISTDVNGEDGGWVSISSITSPWE